jgi:general secretion pathway protein J
MNPRSRTAGLTLIELVVAMALFALVAVMGLQSLTGTIRISDRLTEIDSETAVLGDALALIRSDLSSVVPMLFYPPQLAPEPAISQSADKSTVGLSLAGQLGLTAAHTDRHRAEWRFDRDEGTLTRRFWPALIPAEAAQKSPEITVLRGVTALQLRTWWPGNGWVEGAFPPVGGTIVILAVPFDLDDAGPPPAAYYSGLPNAVELVVQTQAHGDLRIVQALQ